MKLLSSIDENKDAVTKEWVEAKGYTSNTGTITGISVNGTSVATSGVANITAATGVKGDSESSYRTGNVNITKANIGLGNVENKSSATIRGELTSSNVTTALGYTPVNDSSYVHTDNNYTTTEKNKLAGIAAGAEVNVQADWNQTTTTADDYIKNKPTIPTVNNGTLTIQKNGANVQTFTANQSSNVTANITVPNILSGTTDPTSSQGSDGDIYIKIDTTE